MISKEKRTKLLTLLLSSTMVSTILASTPVLVSADTKDDNFTTQQEQVSFKMLETDIDLEQGFTTTLELPNGIFDVKEAKIELPDGTIATVTVTEDLPKISTRAIENKTYTIEVSEGMWGLSFKLAAQNNPVRINSVHSLNHFTLIGSIGSSYLQKMNDIWAQAQIQVNNPYDLGSTTKTVNARLLQGFVTVEYKGDLRIVH